MPRGGKRERAGRKSTWGSGCSFAETKLIRVPAKIAGKVLEFAHKLDSELTLDSVSNSKLEPVPEHKTEIVEAESNPDQLLLFEPVSSFQPVSEELTISSGLSGRALAKRLNVSSGTLQNRKQRDSPLEFAQWTKAKLQARGIEDEAWEYDSETKLYYPIPFGD